MIDGLYELKNWIKRLSNPDELLMADIQAIRGCDTDEATRLVGWYLNLIEKLRDNFALIDTAPVMLMRAPGRVNLLGTHIDHRGGRVNPIAINETILAASPRDDQMVRLASVDAEYPNSECSFDDLLPDGEISQESWSDWTIANSKSFADKGWAGAWSTYPKGAVAYFVNKYGREKQLCGFDVMVDGDIPKAAGLSSSSSLVVGTGQLFLRLNNLPIDDAEFIEDCGRAEWYVGTRGGAGDHAAITWGRQGHVSHINLFPMVPSWSPLPGGYKVILFHSRVEAAKSGGAQSGFNQRVATYEIAMAYIKRKRPDWVSKLTYLRDVNPDNLGIGEAEIYEMLKELPSRATREEILKSVLADDKPAMERWFTLHDDPEDGYHIRDICLYGLAECARSLLLEERLRAGDIEGAGELLDLSHDGDRVSELGDNGQRVSFDPGVSDSEIDVYVNKLASSNISGEDAPIWKRPGGYTASCYELDEMVDIARSQEGVAAACLIGAGLGGCMLVLAKNEVVDSVIVAMKERYYVPNQLEPFAEICTPVAGAGVIELR